MDLLTELSRGAVYFIVGFVACKVYGCKKGGKK